MSRTSRFAAALATWLAVVLALTIAPPRAFAAVPAPTGLVSTSQATTAVALTWAKVSGVPAYRVAWRSADQAAKTLDVTAAYAEITGLSPGTGYSLTVQALDSAGAPASPASAALTVKTQPTGGYRLLSPTGLTATVKSTMSMTFSWAARGGAARYRLRYSKNMDGSGASYKEVSGTSTRVTGLSPNTTYYVVVRALSSTGTALSQYSPRISAKTIAYPLTAVTSVARVSTSTTAIALGWAAKTTAKRYRIRYSTSSSMSSPKYAYATVNYRELTSLRSGTAYYLQVRVVDALGDGLSPYSGTVKISTRASGGYPLLAPRGLKVTGFSAVTVGLSWTSRGTDLRYQVAASPNANLSGATTRTVTTTSATMTGLTPNTTYYFAVRVVSATSAARSEYSLPPVSARTTTAQAALLKVASFNVRCASCAATITNEKPWTERRGPLVARVLDQHPDVISFQEASQSKLLDSAGNTIDLSQFQDLVQRLGSPYKLTNPYRYNCVNGYSNSKCVYQDRGASQGTKLVYDSSTLTMEAQGSTLLPSDPGRPRYVAWAIFQHNASGKRLFYANAHLEANADSAGSTHYYDLRIAETKAAVATIKAKNPSGYPVIFGGDLNSNKWAIPSNGPYDVLVAAGYVDPLGNTYQSKTPAASATVEHRIRTEYNGYNGFKLYPPKSTTINGTYVDYLFMSPGIRVPEWETVLDLDDSGAQIGVIPSDHNMIRATVVIP